MFCAYRANNVDIFQTGLPIQTQVRQVLAKETEAFTEKKDRDQSQDDHSDERVAAEERLDSVFDRGLSAARFRPAGYDNARVSDALHAKPSFADGSAPRQRL